MAVVTGPSDGIPVIGWMERIADSSRQILDERLRLFNRLVDAGLQTKDLCRHPRWKRASPPAAPPVGYNGRD